MSVIEAGYFDGKSSVKRPVGIVVSRGKLKIIGRDLEQEFDARLVRRSLRIADTPRWLYLPGGGACVTSDNAAVDRITRERGYERTLHKWESRPAYAALAVALVVGMLWLLVDRGVPVAVEHIAEHIPVEAEATLGRETLRALDERVMRKSTLPGSKQNALRAKFADMARAAGETTPHTLEFRESFLGANAFALPSGIIIVTDELVRVSKSDDEVLGVLAHELGHVKHRHTMRRLLEGSATALIIAGVTGDVASTTSLAAAAPTLLLQTKYSRDNEREADAYAVEMMRRANVDPTHLARILTRMERRSGARGTRIPTFLSTHPQTAEREALALAAAGETRGPSRGEGKRIDFTGLWKEDCEQLYGLQFKPLEKQGVYSVSLCGPAGCLDPGTYRPNTTVQGDASYDVLHAEEILIKQGRGDFTSYVKCTSEVMPEVADR
jgi:Zn-dependent protease with chaperone function